MLRVGSLEGSAVGSVSNHGAKLVLLKKVGGGYQLANEPQAFEAKLDGTVHLPFPILAVLPGRYTTPQPGKSGE